MSESQVKSNATGAFMWGIAMLTTAALFLLQVLGVIHVSYWVIFAPILFALGFTVAMIIIALVILGGGYLALRRFDKKHAPSITPTRPRGYDR